MSNPVLSFAALARGLAHSRRHSSRQVVARELYAYGGKEMFETDNLADIPAAAKRPGELARLLP